MSSRESLLASIRPGMRLNRDFFLKVYGYSITRPGFKEEVLTALGAAGCSRAREYYACVVVEYEHEHNKEVKEAAAWYVKQLEEKRSRREVRKSWAQQEVSMMKLGLLKQKLRLLRKKQAVENPLLTVESSGQ